MHLNIIMIQYRENTVVSIVPVHVLLCRKINCNCGSQHPWRRGVARGVTHGIRYELKMSEPKLEISANQEPHAAKIRARNLAITATATTTSSDDLKEASDSEKGRLHPDTCLCAYDLTVYSAQP